MRPLRIAGEGGVRLVKEEYCQMSVYSSPSVWVAVQCDIIR